MALDKASLQSALADLFGNVSNFPKTALEAGQRWAKVYADYASKAQSCQAVPPLPASISVAQATLAATLGTAFSAFDPVSTSTLFANALVAFWLAPPVAFTGTTPGVVTLAPGGPVLQAALAAAWVSNIVNKVSADFAAAQHATLFDTFTRTVVVTHSPPSACALTLV